MRIANEHGTLNAYNISGHEVQTHDRYGYKIIAVVYSEHFWKAYRGLTDWSDEKVASQGDEIPHEVARYLFSTINAMIPNYG